MDPDKDNTLLSLALWEPDDEMRNRTVHMLARLGFHVQGCRDVASLFQWLDLRDADLVLVGESAPELQVIEVALPRLSTCYGASILVQALNVSQEMRLNVLRAGAHMCLDRHYEATELAALLRAQARRALRQRRRGALSRQDTGFVELSSTVALIGSPKMLASLTPPPPPPPPSVVNTESFQCRPPAPPIPTVPSSSPSLSVGTSLREPWRILYQGWVLVTPGGKHIPLTGTERACFLCLLDNPKRELLRTSMQTFMSAANLRSVNVAISRLRKKIGEAGELLPLHTVHSMGYVFVGELIVQEE